MVIHVDAICTGKLKRIVLLLQRDVKKDAMGDSEGTHPAKKTHVHNGYGVDGCI
jgi:hypothetical protein